MYIADELKKYFKQKIQNLNDYTSTGVTMVDPAIARTESSKSVNPTMYDRYEQYHYQPGEMSKLDKKIGDAVEKIKADDVLRIDTAAGRIENLTTGDVFQAQPLPGFVQEIAKAGGLINYIKEKK